MGGEPILSACLTTAILPLLAQVRTFSSSGWPRGRVAPSVGHLTRK